MFPLKMNHSHTQQIPDLLPQKKKVRDSNMELLRILSMLMVLALHAVNGPLGSPTTRLVNDDPCWWGGWMWTEAAVLPCVNVFVLITGWFGTHFKMRSALSLVFQMCFVSALTMVGFRLTGGILPSDNWKVFSSLFSYWFINSYLLLYLFSPVLNSFVEHSNEREHRRLLLLLFPVLILGTDFFHEANNGYSAVWFAALYLLGRYLRLYFSPQNSCRSFHWVGVYLLSTTLSALIFFLHVYCGNPYLRKLPHWLISYTNLFLVVSAVALIMCFSRLKVKSRVINFLAAGSLTAYLTHQQLFVRSSYKVWFQTLKANETTLMLIVEGLATILLIYLLSSLLDIVRRKVWDGIVHLFTLRR